jgi:hypothetical protein
MERRVLYAKFTQLTPAVAVSAAVLVFAIVTLGVRGHYTWWSIGVFALILGLGWWMNLRRKAAALLPVAFLDESGLTISPRPGGFRPAPVSVTVPWSNVGTISAWYLTEPREDAGFGQARVAVRDLERYVANVPPECRDSARKFAAANGGSVTFIPSVQDLTVPELVQLIETYRDTADATGAAVSS